LLYVTPGICCSKLKLHSARIANLKMAIGCPACLHCSWKGSASLMPPKRMVHSAPRPMLHNRPQESKQGSSAQVGSAAQQPPGRALPPWLALPPNCTQHPGCSAARPTLSVSCSMLSLLSSRIANLKWRLAVKAVCTIAGRDLPPLRLRLPVQVLIGLCCPLSKRVDRMVHAAPRLQCG
jgi:hypothetical protein